MVNKPTPEKFEEFVIGIKPLIDPEINILLTTWNEFSEGNGIEPTKEFGFAYVDCPNKELWLH